MEFSINKNRKSLCIIRDIFRTQWKQKGFANIVVCTQLLTIFAKHFISRVSLGDEYDPDKTKSNLGALSLVSQKSRTSKFLLLLN